MRKYAAINLLVILCMIQCKNSDQELKMTTNTSRDEQAMTNTTIETQLMIRKPVDQVFKAFVDPEITTKFWFTKSSGKLENGATVTWEWEMYHVSTQVHVKEIIENQLISFQWGEPATFVDIHFKELSHDNTYVIIQNHGFEMTGQDLIDHIKDGTGGFTTVLDGLKAYLEHSIQLNLIGDKFPKEILPEGK